MQTWQTITEPQRGVILASMWEPNSSRFKLIIWRNALRCLRGYITDGCKTVFAVKALMGKVSRMDRHLFTPLWILHHFHCFIQFDHMKHLVFFFLGNSFFSAVTYWLTFNLFLHVLNIEWYIYDRRRLSLCVSCLVLLLSLIWQPLLAVKYLCFDVSSDCCPDFWLHWPLSTGWQSRDSGVCTEDSTWIETFRFPLEQIFGSKKNIRIVVSLLNCLKLVQIAGRGFCRAETRDGECFDGLNFNKNIYKKATVTPTVAGNYGFMVHVYMIHEPQAF